MNNTLTELNLYSNSLGEGAGQAIAAALGVHTTLTELNLGYNQLRKGVKSAVRQSWGNRGELELNR